MTHKEIENTYAAQLNTGKVVIASISEPESGNPDFKVVQLAQLVENASSNNSNLTPFQMKIKGWGSRLVTAVDSMATDQLKDCKEGDTIDDIYGIEASLQIEDTYEPISDRQSQRANSEGESIVCKETGKPVYRNVVLTSKEDCKHTIIKSTLESNYVAQAKKAKVEATA